MLGKTSINDFLNKNTENDLNRFRQIGSAHYKEINDYKVICFCTLVPKGVVNRLEKYLWTKVKYLFYFGNI